MLTPWPPPWSIHCSLLGSFEITERSSVPRLKFYNNAWSHCPWTMHFYTFFSFCDTISKPRPNRFAQIVPDSEIVTRNNTCAQIRLMFLIYFPDQLFPKMWRFTERSLRYFRQIFPSKIVAFRVRPRWCSNEFLIRSCRLRNVEKLTTTKMEAMISKRFFNFTRSEWLELWNFTS